MVLSNTVTCATISIVSAAFEICEDKVTYIIRSKNDEPAVSCFITLNALISFFIYFWIVIFVVENFRSPFKLLISSSCTAGGMQITVVLHISCWHSIAKTFHRTDAQINCWETPCASVNLTCWNDFFRITTCELPQHVTQKP